MEYLLSAIIGYLLGSIPVAYLVIKKSKGIDITNAGSGNVGAMNSFEVTGSKYIGLLVLIIDALKGLLSVYLCLLFFHLTFVFPAIALFFAVFSHCFNPWIDFKGGRGLATAAGGAALLFPYALFLWGLLWVIAFLIQKDIIWANIWATPSSLIIIFLSPAIAVKYSFPHAATNGELMLFSMALLIIIFVKHIEPLKDIIKEKKSSGSKTMTYDRKRILIISSIIIVIILIVFVVKATEHAPLFVNSTDGYSLRTAQDNEQNNSAITNSRNNIITGTVKKVSPAVVGINVTEIRQYRNPFGSFFDDPFFRQFFNNRSYSEKIKGLGSGFIISPDGYIVTNDHVAGNATEITITMTDGKHYEAKVVGTDPITDICLLKVDASDLPYEILGNSSDVMIGEWVIAFGNPFGLFEINDKPTVTVGVISSTGMNLEPIDNRYYINMLQTDAAINGGNSGGPLVNSEGEVIGMNTLIFTGGSGNQGSIGLGFAIPIDKIKRIVAELKDKGKIDRDFDPGMRIQSIDEQIANYYNLEEARGVIITQILPDSPAKRAGLKVGDIILQVENYRINDDQTIIGVFQEFRKGQTITLNILRDNKPMTIQMKLENK